MTIQEMMAAAIRELLQMRRDRSGFDDLRLGPAMNEMARLFGVDVEKIVEDLRHGI